jgi:hypothetical protein
MQLFGRCANSKRLRAGAFEAAGDDMKSEWRLAKVQAAVSRL